MVESSVGKVCYKIKRADISEKKKDSRVVHVQSLKPFRDRPNFDDPGNISFEDIVDVEPEEDSIHEKEARSIDEETTKDMSLEISSRGRIIKKPKWLDNYVAK